MAEYEKPHPVKSLHLKVYFLKDAYKPLHVCMFQTAVAQKLVVCGLSLLFHMTVSKTLPVEYNIDDHFRATASLPTRIIYLYLSLMAARPKYYFAWTLGKQFLRMYLYMLYSVALT